MSELNPVFAINMGKNVQPFGSFPEPLPFGAFPYRLLEAGLGASRKAGSSTTGLRVIVEIIEPAMAGDRNCAGARVEKLFNLPVPKSGTTDQYEFGKEPGTQGYRNSMSIAAIKAFLVSIGEPLQNVIAMENNIQLDMTKYIGRQGVLFNEPAPAGNKDDVYAEYHWLDPDNGAKALNGTFVPQLKKTRQNRIATNSLATSYAMPSGGASGQALPPGVNSFAPVIPGTGPHTPTINGDDAFGDSFDSRLG
jgi:hypothetical protein